MASERPYIVIVAGPNGAGKSTTASSILQGALGVVEFVNADIIAQGLSGFRPETAAFQAGRIMLERIRYLATERLNFAFEITLASRTYASWIKKIRQTGYRCLLVFLWLPSPELAVSRVRERVRLGGHDIHEEIIRRRYHAGIGNFFQLYRPLTEAWYFYDNSQRSPQLIASSITELGDIHIENPRVWRQIKKDYNGKEKGKRQDF